MTLPLEPMPTDGSSRLTRPKLFTLAVVASSVVLGLANPVTLFLWVLLFVTVVSESSPERVLGTTVGSSIVVMLMYGTTNAPASLKLVIVIGLCIAVLSARRRSASSVRPGTVVASVCNIAVFVLLMLILGRSFLTENLAEYRRDTLPLAIAGYFVFSSAQRYTKEDLRTTARILVWFAVLQAVQAVIEFRGIRIAPWSTYAKPATAVRYNALLDTDFRAEAFLGHPIPLSMLFATCIVLLWHREVVPMRPMWKLILSAGFLYAIALTGSRSAFVALGVALVVAVIAPRLGARSRAAAVFLIGALAAAYVTSTTVRAYVTKNIETFTGSGSYSHRAGAFEAFDKLTTSLRPAQVWLGNGIGSEAALFDRGLLQSDNFHVIDNMYISAFVWAGLIGLGALVLLTARTLLNTSPVVTLLGVILALYLNSFDVLRWQGPGSLFFLVAGMSLAPALQQRPIADAPPPATNSPRS